MCKGSTVDSEHLVQALVDMADRAQQVCHKYQTTCSNNFPSILNKTCSSNYNGVMAGPPQLTAEQRQAALAKAGEVRRKRAEVKAMLKMRSISLSDLLEQAETDEVVAGTKVLAVLESLPGMGKVRARRMMDEIGIADSRRIRGLGDQQRASLLARCGN